MSEQSEQTSGEGQPADTGTATPDAPSTETQPDVEVNVGDNAGSETSEPAGE